MSAVSKTLKIKTGTVKRLLADLRADASELEAEKARLERLRSEGADEARIKQQENVIAEAEGCEPATKTMLAKAVKELAKAVADAKNDPSIAEKDMEAAEAQLAAGEEACKV